MIRRAPWFVYFLLGGSATLAIKYYIKDQIMLANIWAACAWVIAAALELWRNR